MLSNSKKNKNSDSEKSTTFTTVKDDKARVKAEKAEKAKAKDEAKAEKAKVKAEKDEAKAEKAKVKAGKEEAKVAKAEAKVAKEDAKVAKEDAKVAKAKAKADEQVAKKTKKEEKLQADKQKAKKASDDKVIKAELLKDKEKQKADTKAKKTDAEDKNDNAKAKKADAEDKKDTKGKKAGNKDKKNTKSKKDDEDKKDDDDKKDDSKKIQFDKNSDVDTCGPDSVLDGDVCVDKYSTAAKQALSEKRLSASDHLKVDCIKDNDVVNLHTARCISMSGNIGQNLYTEQKADPKKWLLRTQDLEKYVRNGKVPKNKGDKANKEKANKETVDKNKVEENEEENSEDASNPLDNGINMFDEEERKRKISKPQDKIIKQHVVKELSKDDFEDYYLQIKEKLKKYDGSVDVEKKAIAEELTAMKKSRNEGVDRFDEHQEYLFNFNAPQVHHYPDEVDDSKTAELIDVKSKKKKPFKLTDNQKFVKKFLSPYTGNTGMLLYHGVGVGKTCSALQMAESFMNFFDNRTMIVSSRTLHANFRKELFDPDMITRDRKDYSKTTYSGCIGNRILKNIQDWKYLEPKDLESNVMLMIKKLYEFVTYQELVNRVTKEKDQLKLKNSRLATQPYRLAEMAEAKYSNRVIIIDEVHNIRNPGMIQQERVDEKPIKKGKDKGKDKGKKTEKGDGKRNGKKQVEEEVEEVDEEEVGDEDDIYVPVDISDDNIADENIADPRNEDLKQLPLILKEIMLHAKNVRLVLLTATPMFDKPDEINDIIDLLMINDKYKIEANHKIYFEPIPADKSEVVDPKKPLILSDVLDFESQRKIKLFAKNYVSYMRGENPVDFPLRLFPSVSVGEDKVMTTKDHPYKQFDALEPNLKESEHIKLIELHKTNMSDVQFKRIEGLKAKQEAKRIRGKAKVIEDNKRNIYSEATQISNVHFPPNDPGNLDFVKSEDRFRVTFNTRVEDSKLVVRYNDGQPEILSEQNISTYAPKMKTIVDSIKNSEGIILVYSEYLYCGVIPLSIALETAGFHKYNNKNMYNVNNPKSTVNNSYITITANENISGNAKERTEELEILKGEGNKNGELIKVVIINRVGSEGYDFKNIRAVHILEPWYNLNRLEQVIGRGVRKNSHGALVKEKRNTTIYFHCLLSPEKDSTWESIDYKNYRRAVKKQTRISHVQKLLQESSIDCGLNKNVLIFKDLEKRNITTPTRKIIKDFDPNDKDYSRICNYGVCQITCENDRKTELRNFEENGGENFNANLLQFEIETTMNLITDMMSKNKIVYISEKDFYDRIGEKKQLVKLALEKLIRTKETFSSGGVSGYILNIGNYIVFNPLVATDEALTKQEQTNPPVKIEDRRVINNKLVLESITVDIMYEIQKSFDNRKLALGKYLRTIEDAVVYQLIIDELSYTELELLIATAAPILISEIMINNKPLYDALRKTCIVKGDINQTGDFNVITYNHYNAAQGALFGVSYWLHEENKLESTVRDELIHFKDKETLLNVTPIRNANTAKPVGFRNATGKILTEMTTDFKIWGKTWRNCKTFILGETGYTFDNTKPGGFDEDNLIKPEFKNLLEDTGKDKKLNKKNKTSKKNQDDDGDGGKDDETNGNKDRICQILEYMLTYYNKMDRPGRLFIDKFFNAVDSSGSKKAAKAAKAAKTAKTAKTTKTKKNND